MIFTIYDYSSRVAWQLRGRHFKVQSRDSLSTLKPREAWAVRVGFRGTGRFVAIIPKAYTPGLDLECDFDVEVSGGAAFINIACPSDGAWLLYSFRPVEGGNWRRLDQRPPLVQRIVSPAPTEVLSAAGFQSSPPPPSKRS